MTLLDKAVIIPFFNEQNPIEAAFNSKYTVSEEGKAAWLGVCRESTPRCVRLSWDDADNKSQIKTHLSTPFHTRLPPLSVRAANDPVAFLQNLHGLEAKIEAEEANRFKKHIRKLRDELNRIEDDNRLATREELYRTFVVGDGTDPSDSFFDGGKEFMVETKQLIDLVYNTNLSDALQILALTPRDSPTRGALQELATWKGKPADPNQLAQVIRQLRFDILQKAINFIDFGKLSVSDVVAIRNTNEWLLYKEALEELIKNADVLNSIEDAQNDERGITALEHAYANLLVLISSRFTRWECRRLSRLG